MAMAQCCHAPVNLLTDSAMAVIEASSPSSPCSSSSSHSAGAAARFSSSFLPRSSFLRSQKQQRSAPCTRLPPIRAIEFDQDTMVAIGVGLAGIAFGIGVPVFYESQMKSASTRENDQPCFPCAGSGAQTCRFCLGAGNLTVELGGGEKQESKCVNCEGAGSITCTTCQGTGIQPRYLDRREYKDDD